MIIIGSGILIRISYEPLQLVALQNQDKIPTEKDYSDVILSGRIFVVVVWGGS